MHKGGAMDTIEQPVFAVLPAAGCGDRFSSNIPKQFTDLNGQLLILYTLKVLHRIKWMHGIFLAISEDWMDFMEELIDRCRLHRVELVKGGPSRHASIRNCISAIATRCELEQCSNGQGPGEPIVIVHDAVRPFVDEDTFYKVVLAAVQHRASGAVCPLVSTVLSVTEDGFMDEALNRSVHTASHTPQAFALDVIKSAYDQISHNDLEKGTECLDLAWKHGGVKAKLVPAQDVVWKVTYRKDIYAAEALAREICIKACVVSAPELSGLAGNLCTTLQSRKLQVKTCEHISAISREEDINAVVLIVLQPRESCDLSDNFLLIHDSFNKTFQSDIPFTLSVMLCLKQKVTDAMYGQLRQLCRDLSRDGEPEKRMIHLIVLENFQENSPNYNHTKVSELVASLVYDRNPLMSGQIFTFP